MKVYERIENGTATRVSVSEALAEAEHALRDEADNVETMSAGSGRYDILYKDGNHILLVPMEVSEEGEPQEWDGTKSNGAHLHRFDKDLHARCNRRIRSSRAAYWAGVLVGHESLRTRTGVETGEYAHLYTFCPKCEKL